MSNYNNYYQTENLFGAPYPELIEFYAKLGKTGKLLDLGCGQGRDAIALAKLGFDVIGIDASKVGIDQMNAIAQRENLPLQGITADIYEYSGFDQFDYILLDSMFHFNVKEREKESRFLEKIVDCSKPQALITICIQQTGKKVEILNRILEDKPNCEEVSRTNLTYTFVDQVSNHSSQTNYQMITIQKK